MQYSPYLPGWEKEMYPTKAYLRIRLVNGVLLSHGTRYDIEFQ